MFDSQRFGSSLVTAISVPLNSLSHIQCHTQDTENRGKHRLIVIKWDGGSRGSLAHVCHVFVPMACASSASHWREAAGFQWAQCNCANAVYFWDYSELVSK